MRLFNFIRYGVLILFFQGLSACDGQTTAGIDQQQQNNMVDVAKPQQEDAKFLVLAFGDSLYAGYGLKSGEGLVPMLQSSLQADGMSVKVHPAGVSGDTTMAGLKRFSFVLDNLKRKPDLILLGLGGNDMLRGISPAQTAENLTQMMDIAKSKNIPVMLTGMIAPTNMGAEYVNKFNAIYPKLAKKYQANLYPFILDGVVTDKKYMLPDAIHPNAEGIKIIVNRISPMVNDSLQKAAR
ncbi:hypothetical protein LPB140_10695 [Sphingorhabdus lutea]|uniref:SGNH hydrolase-type esterase domain-containing protein n=1 Tax=Sphingorhabdus lutea TaxID=1913578 RepID=A0A1L3JF84_9SPHN|nr:arylesterase [Sphingorhabdus lutea]APG63795.1 hypothetical protein LPB140_10695 [Sphingorhabdus lutea]